MQRSSRRRDAYSKRDVASAASVEREGIAREEAGDARRVRANFHHEGVDAVERRLRYTGHGDATIHERRDRGAHSRAKRRQIRCMQQRQVSLPLAALHLLERACEALDFLYDERRIDERRLLSLRILEVSLHAHGAEQEPAKADVRGVHASFSTRPSGRAVRDQRVLEAARRPTPRDERARTVPCEVGRAAVCSRGEAEALVLSVGPEVDDALGTCVEIHLE